MTKVRKQDAYISSVVAVLIIFALCCRFIGRAVDNDFVDKFLNFVRTFIYIGLILAWLFSVNKRVMQYRHAVPCLLWLFLCCFG